MKNLKVVFALVFATIFMLTSCQKENLSELETSKQQIETEINNTVAKQLPTINLANLVQADSLELFENDIDEITAQDRSGQSYNVTSKNGSVAAGEWYRFSVYKINMRPGRKYTAKLIPISGDPDLYIYGAEPPYYTKNLRWLKTSNKGGLTSEQLTAELYDLNEEERRLDFWVYGFNASSFRLEVSYEYEDYCAFSTGRGSAQICDYFSSYDAYQPISPQSYNWRTFDYGYEDALMMPNAGRQSALRVKGAATSISRKGIDYVVLDLGGQYSPEVMAYGEHPFRRLAWDLYIPSNEVGEIRIVTKGKETGERIIFRGGNSTQKGTATLILIDGRKKTFSFSNDEWLRVELFMDHRSFFDTHGPTHKLIVDNYEVLNWGAYYRDNRTASTPAFYTIEGLAFKGVKGSEFYVDSVCFETDIDWHPY